MSVEMEHAGPGFPESFTVLTEPGMVLTEMRRTEPCGCNSFVATPPKVPLKRGA
jgi:hypothetical protein